MSWLELSGTPEEESLNVLKESQKVLLAGLRQAIGEAKSLTYQIDKGALVKLYPEGDDSFTLEFASKVPGEHDVTRLYDAYFPFPEESETPLGYHGRLLEAIDTFVDDIAIAPLVEMDK